MVNREKAQERAAKREGERAKASQGSFSFWKPSDKHLVRFLSDPVTGDCYWEAKKHSFINADIRNVVCPKSADEDLGIRNACPICDLASAYFAEKKTEEARNATAKTRFIYTILDMDQIAALKDEELKEAGNVIYVFERGPKLFDDFIQYVVDEDWGDITDPESGVTFTMKKTGSGTGTKISLLPSPQGQSALPAPIQEIIESQFPNLDRLIYPTVSARQLYYLLDDHHRDVLAEHGKNVDNYLDVSVFDTITGVEKKEEETEPEPVEETPVEEPKEEEPETTATDIAAMKAKIKKQAAALKKKKAKEKE